MLTLMVPLITSFVLTGKYVCLFVCYSFGRNVQCHSQGARRGRGPTLLKVKYIAKNREKEEKILEKKGKNQKKRKNSGRGK